MEFFGWLLKGRCEVSLLDVIMFFIEAGSVSVLMYFLFGALEKLSSTKDGK